MPDIVIEHELDFDGCYGCAFEEMKWDQCGVGRAITLNGGDLPEIGTRYEDAPADCPLRSGRVIVKAKGSNQPCKVCGKFPCECVEAETVVDLAIHEKVWGYEDWIVNDAYCGKRLYLRAGYRCSLHYHREKDEAFYVASGLVEMTVGETVRIFRPGARVRISPGTRHRFAGIEDSVIFEFSTHHDDADSFRLEPSGTRPSIL